MKMKTVFLANKKLSHQILVFSLVTTVLFAILLPSLLLQLSTVSVFLIFLLVAVHELGHFLAIRYYRIRWQPLVTWFAIGFKGVGGRLTRGQWLVTSLAGLVATLPFLAVDFRLWPFLFLGASGDFYVSWQFLRQRTQSLRFYKNGVLLFQR